MVADTEDYFHIITLEDKIKSLEFSNFVYKKVLLFVGIISVVYFYLNQLN